MSSFFVVGVSDCSLKFLMMALVSFSLADGFGLFESTIQSFAILSVSVHWNGPFLVLSVFLYIPVFLQLIATELLAIPYRRYIKNPHIIHAADSGQVISSTLDKMLQNVFVIVSSFFINVEINYLNNHIEIKMICNTWYWERSPQHVSMEQLESKMFFLN